MCVTLHQSPSLEDLVNQTTRLTWLRTRHVAATSSKKVPVKPGPAAMPITSIVTVSLTGVKLGYVRIPQGMKSSNSSNI